MKKAIIISLLILIVFSVSFLMADEKTDLWNKAISESNIEVRMVLLKEYDQKFGNQIDNNTMFLYLNMTTAAFQLKQYEEAIVSGEKALAFQDMSSQNKLNLYLYLANSYNVLKKDFDKAYQYADLIVKLGQDSREGADAVPGVDRKYIAPALRIQSRILYSTGLNNHEKMKEAATKAIEAYKADDSRSSAEFAENMSIELYNKTSLKKEAIAALSEVLDAQKSPKHTLLNVLASWYQKDNNAAKAIEYFNKSFEIRKNAKTAYNIGVIYNKMKDSNNAMNFFAKAYVLNSGNLSEKSKDLFRHIFYNVIHKDKPAEEQDKLFQSYVNETKSTMGLN
jgi:tetratricopeptide (TPR) repeat protein